MSGTRTPMYDVKAKPEAEPAPTSWRARPQPLVIAVALALVLAGGLAFIVVGGDDADPAAPGTASTGPQAAPTGAPDPEVGTEPGSTGKARNPFAADEVSEGGGDDGSAPRATVTVTKTASATPGTYVSLFRVGSGANPTADLAVNGVGYDNARPGDVLGKGSTAVTFTGVSTEGDCVVLTHRKHKYPLCDSQMLLLG